MAYDSRQIPVVSYKDRTGSIIFAIDTDGSVLTKSVVFRDGTTMTTAGAGSSNIDSGTF